MDKLLKGIPGVRERKRIDYQLAKTQLELLFIQAEKDFRGGITPTISVSSQVNADILFSSSIQSYREALLGCGLARLLDSTINIRLPYVSQGPDAFNGRTLDEKVINPFLRDRMVPCSKGPYLASFRRSVKFVPATSKGLRDKKAYQAFLNLLGDFEKADIPEEISHLISYLLYRFVELREASNVVLARVVRLNLEQHEKLIDGILATSSGGLLPVLLTVAMFNTLKQAFELEWEIDWQGINVADKASGVGGDITIRKGDRILLAVEVTERPIDRSRVVSTFHTKISPHAIEDYLFISTGHLPEKEAYSTALQYFAQGHDVSFLLVKPWLINLLAIVGSNNRSLFISKFIDLLDSHHVPASLKVRWNDLIRNLLE